MIINGLRIPHPATFKRRETERPRIGISPPLFKTKPTVTIRPGNPRAMHAMPVIAIVAAIGSIAAGSAALAAGTAILGSTILGTVVAGAMIVGGAATLIGVATGNKNLVKYGGMLSAVAGLGMGLAGLTGTLTSTAGAAAEGAAAGVGAGAESAAVPGITGADVIAADGNLASAAAPAATTPGVLGAATDVAQPAATGVLGAPAAAPTAATATPAPSAADTTPFAPGENPTPFKSPGIAAAEKPQGFFDNAGKWINQNQAGIKIGMDALSGYAKGKAAEPLQNAQISNLNAATDESRRRAYDAYRKAQWGSGKLAVPFEQYKGA